MDQRIFVAQLNIEYFRRKLLTEPDAAARRTLSCLLAEEAAKLWRLAPSDEQPDPTRLIDVVSSVAVSLLERQRDGGSISESLAHLAAILDQMPHGIGVMDSSGKWVVANTAMRWFMHKQIAWQDQPLPQDRSRDAGRRPSNVVDWPNADATRIDMVIPGIEFVCSPENGHEAMARVSAKPLLYSDGNAAGVIAIVEAIEPASDWLLPPESLSIDRAT